MINPVYFYLKEGIFVDDGIVRNTGRSVHNAILMRALLF